MFEKCSCNKYKFDILVKTLKINFAGSEIKPLYQKKVACLET